MKRTALSIVLGSLLPLAFACSPSATSSDADSNESSQPAEQSTLSGSWEVARIQGYQNTVLNRSRQIPMLLTDEALDHEAHDMTLQFDDAETGTVESKSNCRELAFIFQYGFHPINMPVIERLGVYENVSLFAQVLDHAKCRSSGIEDGYVVSRQKFEKALTPRRTPLEKLPVNSGLFRDGSWTGFTADKECMKLSEMRYIRLTNQAQLGESSESVACVGHKVKDKDTLRMIIKPAAQVHVILADFVRKSDSQPAVEAEAPEDNASDKAE